MEDFNGARFGMESWASPRQGSNDEIEHVLHYERGVVAHELGFLRPRPTEVTLGRMPRRTVLHSFH